MLQFLVAIAIVVMSMLYLVYTMQDNAPLEHVAAFAPLSDADASPRAACLAPKTGAGGLQRAAARGSVSTCQLAPLVIPGAY